MKHHCFQSMIVPPRQSSSDPRIAQSAIYHHNFGDDGKLYRTIDERDYGKFKVMSDEELAAEVQRNNDIKNAMLSSRGKSPVGKQTRSHSSSSSGATFSAPMFGKSNRSQFSQSQASRTAAVESNENDYDDAGYRKVEPTKTTTKFKLKKRPDSSRDVTKERDSEDEQPIEDDEYPRNHNPERMKSNGYSVFRRSQSPPSRVSVPEVDAADDPDRDRQKKPVTSVMTALKLKYEQNLDVIEKLFDEKKSMEKLVQSLDSQLTMARRELASPRYAGGAADLGPNHYSATDAPDGTYRVSKGEMEDDRGRRSSSDDDYRRGVKSTQPALQRSTRDFLRPTDSYKHSPDRRGVRSNSAKSERATRSSYDEGDSGPGPGSSRSVGDTARSAYAFSPRGGGSQKPWNNSIHILDTSPENGTRYTSSSPVARATTPLSASSYNSQNRGRSSFAGRDAYSRSRSGSRSHSVGGETRGSRSRSFSTEPRLSANLQADQDRYVQRRRAFEDRERDKVSEQRKFEESLRDRQMRASRTGGEFTEMIKRDALTRKSQELRTEERMKKELEKESEEQERKERDKRRLIERTKPAEEMSWSEMKIVQEKLRAERIALRVAEMTGVVGFEPSKGSEGVARQAARSKLAAPPDAPLQAEDPAAVLARLERQRREWDSKLERIKDQDRAARQKAAIEVRVKSGEQLGTTASLGDKLFHGTAKMVQRALEAEEKKVSRNNDKIKKESDERERKMEEERKRRELLLNSKVPEEGRRLTKIAELRATMVRKNLQEKEAEKAKEALREKKRKAAEKQHGEVMRTIISERDRDRKENYQGGFVELNKSQAEIDAVAAENRQRFRARLRENKMKIEQAAEARPSLLIRHDQSIARSKAAASALNKVAQVVVGAKLSASVNSSTSGKMDKRTAIYEDDIFDENQKIVLGYQDDFLDDV